MSAVGGLHRFLSASGLRPPSVGRSLTAVLVDKVVLLSILFFCHVWHETETSRSLYRLRPSWLTVMEVLAAVSLAGNVLQFVEYATKVAKQAKKYHNSVHGRLQRHIEIESSIDDLDELLLKLRDTSKSSGPDGKPVPSSVDPSLQRKAEDCLFVGQELRDTLQKVQISGRANWRNSIRKAFRSLMSEEYIASLQHRLASVQSDLQLHLTIDQREQLKYLQAGQSELLSKLDSVALSIYHNVISGHGDLLDVQTKMISAEFHTLQQQNLQMASRIDDLKATLIEPTTHLVLSPELTPLPTPAPTGRDLYKAVRDERLDVAREMIQQGANVNFINDKDDSRAIHLAVRQGDINIIDLLVENGADIECYNSLGLTPLMLAARYGSVKVVTRLIKASCNVDAKLIACRREVITGIDLDNMKTSDSTALILAAQNGHVAVVRELLSNGASPNAVSNHRFTPLHAAVQNGHPACVEALLAGGASVDPATDGGFTPLIYAANANQKRCAQLLLQYGANINAKKSLGMTALLEAVWTRNSSMVDLLAASGADLDITTGVIDDRHTALQLATEWDDARSVAALLKYGADQGKTLNNGTTAEENARERGDESVIEAFEKHRSGLTR